MALIAFAGICLVGCKKDQKDFYLSDLQGLWQNDQTTTWYMRFTADQGDIAGCYWGREWGDLGDDVTEDDLFDPETYHGNGWFQYKLEKNGDFTYINMMDNKGVDVPKSFKMITLTSSKMTFQNDLKEKKNFTKQ
jgi:hypothetical protein